MEISKDQLSLAALKMGLSEKQAEALWTSLEKNDTIPKTSPFSKLMFYFGALTIISAMTWMLSLSWTWFGGGALFLISFSYALLFTLLGAKLWKKEDLKIPAGLMITVAVCMVPLATYGLETYFNIWPREHPGNYNDYFYLIRSSWIFMELATIFAGLIALRFFPFPFLTAPIFFSAWLLAMDVVPLLTGNTMREPREWISICFGIVILFISYLIDRRKIKDYAFWGYLFGTLTFWIGLTSLIWGRGEFVFFIYFIINLLMMIASILLKRKVLMLFGAFGTFIYFGYLADEIFKGSLLFPIALSVIGLSIMYLGIVYQKNLKWIEEKIINIVPLSMRKLLPYEHDDL